MPPERIVLPTSSLIYAIGDVHGRSDLLSSLLNFVQSDANRRQQDPKVIFLGDIVDRGPDSKRCIDLVADTLKRWPRSKLLLGNHDYWFLRILGTDDPDPAMVGAWLRNGGLPTLYNYDYEPDLAMARAAVKIDYLDHVSLFAEASLLEVDGPFAFVHAGIHPDRPIHEQEQSDCLWIRQLFLEHNEPFSHVIVHGHSITESGRPVVTGNRISLDTGAYATGHLTALIIDPHARALEFAWTKHTGTDIEVGFVEPVWSGIPDAIRECFNVQTSSPSKALE